MPFKKKLIALSSVAGALAVIYILTFILSPENRSRRGAAWTPLAAASQAVRVEIKGSENAVLEKRDGLWRVSMDGFLYPAKQTRVEDLFAALSKKAEYPLSASSEAAWEKLGVGSDAEKITVSDGNITLCDLYFGNTDATGRNIYIRSGEKVRSGADVFSTYLGAAKSWLDLNLFPGHTEQGLTADTIIRMSVTPLRSAESRQPYTLVRTEGGWDFDNGAKADKTTVESALRYILDATADGFVPPQEGMTDADFTPTAGSIILEKGDTTRITITAGPTVEENLQTVKVSSSEYIFRLSEWTAGRIWRARDEFSAKQ